MARVSITTRKAADTEPGADGEHVPSHCLLVFLDETGNEQYSDPRHPVFGIGGCSIISDDYARCIEKPWNTLKRDVLGLAGAAFHAVDFEQSRPTPRQISAISTILTRDFYRLAVTTDINTKRPDGFDGHETVSTVIFDYIRRLIGRHSVRKCMVFFEQSDRGDRLLERNLPLHAMDARNLFGEPSEVVGYTLPKRSLEAGLELADLIIHTSGKQQRKHAQGYADGTRNFTPDFRALFHAAHPSWTLYHSVTAMQERGDTKVAVDSWPPY
jgi:Protein of unknown function (DUF3800)